MTLGSVAVVGSEVVALNMAEELASSDDVGSVTVYGRRRGTPQHTVFARGLARYVFGIEAIASDTVAVLITVPDDAVPEIAVALAGQGPAPPGCAAFHLSGVLPTEALGPLHGQGYALGAFHPLGGAPGGPGGTARVGGGFVAVTGSPAAVAVARRLTDALGAQVLEVPAGRRPLVDAATVLVGGYLEPLIGLAARLMERAGIATDDALPALVSVVRGTLDRIDGGTAGSAANPILRGDVERLALHLRALDAADQRLYALFATEILRVEGDGLDTETREAMQDLLNRYTALEPSGIG